MKDTDLTTKEAFAAMLEGYVVRSCDGNEYCFGWKGRLLGGSIGADAADDAWAGLAMLSREMTGIWSLVKKEEKWTKGWACKCPSSQVLGIIYRNQAAAEESAKLHGGEVVQLETLETTYKRAPEGV